jgi:hypothetical protein
MMMRLACLLAALVLAACPTKKPGEVPPLAPRPDPLPLDPAPVPSVPDPDPPSTPGPSLEHPQDAGLPSPER